MFLQGRESRAKICPLATSLMDSQLPGHAKGECAWMSAISLVLNLALCNQETLRGHVYEPWSREDTKSVRCSGSAEYLEVK